MCLIVNPCNICAFILPSVCLIFTPLQPLRFYSPLSVLNFYPAHSHLSLYGYHLKIVTVCFWVSHCHASSCRRLSWNHLPCSVSSAWFCLASGILHHQTTLICCFYVAKSICQSGPHRELSPRASLNKSLAIFSIQMNPSRMEKPQAGTHRHAHAHAHAHTHTHTHTQTHTNSHTCRYITAGTISARQRLWQRQQQPLGPLAPDHCLVLLLGMVGRLKHMIQETHTHFVSHA